MRGEDLGMDKTGYEGTEGEGVEGMILRKIHDEQIAGSEGKNKKTHEYAKYSCVSLFLPSLIYLH